MASKYFSKEAMRKRLIGFFVLVAVIYLGIAAVGRYHYLMPWHEATDGEQPAWHEESIPKTNFTH